MNQQQKSIPERLKAAQAQHTEEAWEDFEDALCEVNTAEKDLLPDLYECFTDETDSISLMWQLLHTIERFEEEAILSTLVAKTSYLEQHAPYWLSVLWARVLNHDEARARLQYEMLPLMDSAVVGSLQAYLLNEPDLQAMACSLFALPPL